MKLIGASVCVLLVALVAFVCLRRVRVPSGPQGAPARAKIEASAGPLSANITADLSTIPPSLSPIDGPSVISPAETRVRSGFRYDTSGTTVSTGDEVLYGADARIRLKGGLEVSSPNGVMVSDKNQNTIVGDLRVEEPGASVTGADVTIDTESRKVTAKDVQVNLSGTVFVGEEATIDMDRKRISGRNMIIKLPRPNQALEPTATAVTPPAAQEPRQP